MSVASSSTQAPPPSLSSYSKHGQELVKGMSFGQKIDGPNTEFLKAAIMDFPRPDNLVLPDGSKVTDFPLLELGGAKRSGVPLVVSFASIGSKHVTIVLPRDVEKQECIDDDFMNRVTLPGPATLPPGDATCSICMDDFEDDPPLCLKKCETKHYWHKECLKNWLNTKLTCPNCKIQIGKLIGRQPPNGSMRYQLHQGQIAGAKEGTTGKSYYSASFQFPQGKDDDGTPYFGRSETGYLQNTGEGRILLELFKVAFKRCIMFGLGINMTHQVYKPTFNIHLKTNTYPSGAQCHGYPDEDYFLRTMESLQENGVTIEDLYR